MSAVSKEQASDEVDAWLDYKRVRATKREEKDDHIQGMIECVEDGIFVINDDKSITFFVQFPESIGNTTELVFKPRITDDDIAVYFKKMDKKDPMSYILARKAALTGVNSSILKKMDTEDSQIADHITAFFI